MREKRHAARRAARTAVTSRFVVLTETVSWLPTKTGGVTIHAQLA